MRMLVCVSGYQTQGAIPTQASARCVADVSTSWAVVIFRVKWYPPVLVQHVNLQTKPVFGLIVRTKGPHELRLSQSSGGAKWKWSGQVKTNAGIRSPVIVTVIVVVVVVVVVVAIYLSIYPSIHQSLFSSLLFPSLPFPSLLFPSLLFSSLHFSFLSFPSLCFSSYFFASYHISERSILDISSCTSRQSKQTKHQFRALTFITNSTFMPTFEIAQTKHCTMFKLRLDNFHSIKTENQSIPALWVLFFVCWSCWLYWSIVVL